MTPGPNQNLEAAVKSTDSSIQGHSLRTQPHGGALRNGGPNRGGTGRPQSLVSIALRRSEQTAHIELLRAIAAGEPLKVTVVGRNRRVRLLSPTPTERIRAIEAIFVLAGLVETRLALPTITTPPAPAVDGESRQAVAHREGAGNDHVR